MNTLREAMHDYLAMRRGLGFKMYPAGLRLAQFVTFLEQRQAPFITVALSLEWAQEPSTVRPAEWAKRLCFIRGFARYRSCTDPRTEIPEYGLLPYQSSRARPY